MRELDGWKMNFFVIFGGVDRLENKDVNLIKIIFRIIQGYLKNQETLPLEVCKHAES